MNYGLHDGHLSLTSKGCSKKHCSQLNTYNYHCDFHVENHNDYVEIQFKNTRKEYFLNRSDLELIKNDWVIVESPPGYDIGKVTLTGPLVLLQMKRRIPQKKEFKKIYRKATKLDLEKFEEYKAKEYYTMIRTREISGHLGLQMKISDVEYQGDGTKAIFYYIAEERIDFRQLIRKLAITFHIKIVMKQIGARQEAGQIGGIGLCGRELCCAGWIANFTSVSSSAMQIQDISTHIHKLAGQCTKLMCCLNYETTTYKEAQQKFPPRNISLETQSDKYYCIKVDILRNQMYYSTDPNRTTQLVSISPERAFEVILMNKKNQKPLKLREDKNEFIPSYPSILGGNICRFDHKNQKNNKLLHPKNQINVKEK